jgi:hypothetical protein
MAQVSDLGIANATFPTVRADLTATFAALFSANSGDTAPTATVAFQDWVETQDFNNKIWWKRNAANNAWVKLGTINGNTIAFEGTLPSQSGNSGKYLSTNGTVASWAVLALGATVQTFTSSGTFTPTAGKTSFLVFCTGGGGGGGGSADVNGYGPRSGGGGGGGGTAVRMYTSAEMGSTSAVTVGAAGSAGSSSPGNGGAGGTSTFNPDGSGLTITGVGGSGGVLGNFSTGNGGGGGGSTNSQFTTNGQRGGTGNGGAVNTSSGGGTGGLSFWADGRGAGGSGSYSDGDQYAGTAGTAGGIFILEF